MESPLTLPGISQLLIMFQGHFFTIRKASWVNLVLIFFWKTQLSALRLACHCKKLEICSSAPLSSLSVLFLFDNHPPFKRYDSCVVFTGNDSMSWYWSARIAAFSWIVGQIGVLEDSSFLSRINCRANRLLCDLGKLAGHNWSCSMAGFLTRTINSFYSITFFQLFWKCCLRILKQNLPEISESGSKFLAFEWVLKVSGSSWYLWHLDEGGLTLAVTTY